MALRINPGTRRVEDSKPAFAREEYSRRTLALRAEMSREGIDLLYVTDPAHMCYLHGYDCNWYRANSTSKWPPMTGTAVHVDHEQPIHFDYAEHQTLLEKNSVVEETRFFPSESIDGLQYLGAELRAAGWLRGRAALEMLSPFPNRKVSEAIEGVFASAAMSVVDGSLLLRRVRSIKSQPEIDVIEEAMRICDIGIQAASDAIRPGATELEVQGEVLRAMLAAGGEMPAINQGVQAGITSSYEPSGRKAINAGERVYLDLCGVFHRYHANVCRGFWVGEPPAEVVELYRRAAGAYGVLCREARDGRPVSEVARALREYYQGVDLWENQYYLGGYELGIAFPPDWVGEFCFDAGDEADAGVFRSNMVTNFESISGVSLAATEGHAAASGTLSSTIESALIDTLVYGADGARTLSRIPLELLVVDI